MKQRKWLVTLRESELKKTYATVGQAINGQLLEGLNMFNGTKLTFKLDISHRTAVK